MRIGVGSGNPVKRRAVERVLDDPENPDDDGGPSGGSTADRGARFADATVEAVPVASGVSEQPRGRAETVAGAENRATAVLAEGEYDLAVGIEGGIAAFEDGGIYLIMWAAVDDGTRIGRGGGPSMRLPDAIAARVDAGEELGPVMDDVLDTRGVAKRGGAAGALTAGRVDRTDALATAVAGAFGPFVSPLYESL